MLVWKNDLCVLPYKIISCNFGQWAKLESPYILTNPAVHPVKLPCNMSFRETSIIMQPYKIISNCKQNNECHMGRQDTYSKKKFLAVLYLFLIQGKILKLNLVSNIQNLCHFFIKLIFGLLFWPFG